MQSFMLRLNGCVYQFHWILLTLKHQLNPIEMFMLVVQFIKIERRIDWNTQNILFDYISSATMNVIANELWS